MPTWCRQNMLAVLILLSFALYLSVSFLIRTYWKTWNFAILSKYENLLYSSTNQPATLYPQCTYYNIVALNQFNLFMLANWTNYRLWIILFIKLEKAGYRGIFVLFLAHLARALPYSFQFAFYENWKLYSCDFWIKSQCDLY